MKNIRATAVFWTALAFSVFQLSIPVFVPLIDVQTRGLHVLFGIFTALLAFPFIKTAKAESTLSFWDLFLIVIVFLACINIVLNWQRLYEHPGESTTTDLILGAALTLVILDATRRATGWVMPIVVALMFVYVFCGPLLPGMWKHPDLPLRHVLDTVYFSSEGLFGRITGFSATFISVFIIFGAFLMYTGGGKTFMDLALVIAGRYRGGPAKVAVISSALFGSISGSSAANVSVTGNYTIPLMKKLGYRANFAAGVESMASTLGDFTPPIMGIGAFIISEFLGIPYIKVIGYATIPCILSYIGVFSGVHIEALVLGLTPAAKEDIPPWRTVFTWSRLVPFLIPIFLLVWLLIRGYVLITAGFYASITMIILYIFSGFSIPGIKGRSLQLLGALSQGGKAVARIAPIMISVSLLVHLLDLTGVAPKLSGIIMGIGKDNILITLLVAGIVPLILGSALPATPTYIISAAIIAPGLSKLGIDVIACHLFLFYWGCLSSVTPPTCTTVIIAANYAGGDWIKAAFSGMKLGIVAFLIPFFFVIEPALVSRGPIVDIILYSLSAGAGSFILASGLFGYMRSRLNLVLRLLYGLSGVLILYPSHSATLLGIGFGIFAFLYESVAFKSRMALG